MTKSRPSSGLQTKRYSCHRIDFFLCVPGQLIARFVDRTARAGKVSTMEITVRIRDDLAERLGAAGELERRALEALALEEFKLGHLTKPELRRLLGFGTREALDGFLKAHDCSSRTPLTTWNATEKT